jgi:hypothetical protein
MEMGDTRYRCLINTKEKALFAGPGKKEEETGYIERSLCMATCSSSQLRACFSLTLMRTSGKFWKCYCVSYEHKQ